jgi:hypothetical protein
MFQSIIKKLNQVLNQGPQQKLEDPPNYRIGSPKSRTDSAMKESFGRNDDEVKPKQSKNPQPAIIITPTNQGRAEVETYDLNRLLDKTIGEDRVFYKLDDKNGVYWSEEATGRYGWFFTMMYGDFTEVKYSNGVIVALDGGKTWDLDELNYWLRWYDAENPWG